MKKETNKWQTVFTIGKLEQIHYIYQWGWHNVRFGIFNIHKLPEEEGTLHKRLYKGFIIQFRFWVPFEKI